MKKTILIFLALIFISLFLGCSEDVVSSSGEFRATRCAVDEWNGHSPKRIAFDEVGDAYVLDDFSTVYHYRRDPSRLCAFELARDGESFGAIHLSGFADEIEYYGNSLYYFDGISLRRAFDDSFDCSLANVYFDIDGGNIFTGSNMGLDMLKLTAEGCVSENKEFPGNLRIHALAASSGKVATVESVTGTGENPSRLVVYSTSSSIPYRHALSDIEESDTYFCSATRLRFFNSGILLFDKECEKLGVFDREGYFINALNLRELGIRSPKDMAVFENEVYFLTETSMILTYRLDLADLLR